MRADLFIKRLDLAPERNRRDAQFGHLLYQIDDVILYFTILFCFKSRETRLS